MRIDYDAFVLLEPCAEHDVRGFAGHAGNGEELIHLIRHFPAELLSNNFGRSDNRLRLVPKKPRALDDGLDLLRLRCREMRGVGIETEELGGGEVYAHVCGLRGENGGNQKLPSILVPKRARSASVSGIETREYFGYAFWIGWFRGRG